MITEIDQERAEIEAAYYAGKISAEERVQEERFLDWKEKNLLKKILKDAWIQKKYEVE